MHRSLSVVFAALAAALLVAPLVVATPVGAKPRGKDKDKTSAKKQDTTPPTIDHTPVAKHDGIGPLVIEARIVDDKSGVFEPKLLVRAAGEGVFLPVPMTKKEGADDIYTATVPQALLGGDVEYLIEAFDQSGNGPARVGDEGAPLRIAKDVVAPPPLTTPPPPPPSAPAGTVDDGPSGLVIGAGIAVGSVVVLGAALGVGLAVYALRPAALPVVKINVTGPSPVAAAAP